MKTAPVLLMLPFLMGMILSLPGQILPEPAMVIPLYEGVAPGSEKWDWTENTAESGSGSPMVQNVVKPALMYYPADRERATGTAVIIAPGGGFRNLMMSYEGVDIATYLNEMGVDAFVLKYRLIHKEGKGRQSGQDLRKLGAADGQEAVRLVRARAREFGVASDRIGMMGFSAGGYVTLATVMGPVEGRPDFAAPVYAPTGSEWDLPIVVPENAPPLCILASADDKIIPWECSMNLFSAWRDAGFPAEIHIFQSGGHGFVSKGGGADHFMDRIAEWMKVNGWLK